jgi:uncharacterized repeat protein (TIGR03843 family)
MPEDERAPRAADLAARGLGAEEWLELLRDGELGVLGRMPYSSNATFLVELRAGEVYGGAIYKPERGERPLWDFPGSLFRREVAAYELSHALGLDCIPETIVRDDGPYGSGSLQRFIEADPDDHYFTLQEQGRELAQLQRLCGFDLIANNADRKGGHVLLDPSEHLWGIDHGLCFHVEPKLRTVMWDFAGEEIPAELLAACSDLAEGFPPVLEELLEIDEIEALCARAEALLARPRFPAPYGSRRDYPWPLV